MSNLVERIQAWFKRPPKVLDPDDPNDPFDRTYRIYRFQDSLGFKGSLGESPLYPEPMLTLGPKGSQKLWLDMNDAKIMATMLAFYAQTGRLPDFVEAQDLLKALLPP